MRKSLARVYIGRNQVRVESKARRPIKKIGTIEKGAGFEKIVKIALAITPGTAAWLLYRAERGAQHPNGKPVRSVGTIQGFSSTGARLEIRNPRTDKNEGEKWERERVEKKRKKGSPHVLCKLPHTPIELGLWR